MAPVNSIAVSSTTDSPTILQKAVDLATKLGLPVEQSPLGSERQWRLDCSPDGLHLLQSANGRITCRLFVDFVSGKNGFRHAHHCTVQQPLARALGIKRGHRPTVFDGTAGLGADAWVAASLGCPVTMCERSPLLHALLADGLHRAATATAPAAAVSARVRLMHAEATAYLRNAQHSYQVIYLDPMYPVRQGSALNSLVLRTLRDLVGDDHDSGELLEAGLAVATERVVVKRPRGAPPLAGLMPSYATESKKIRFDVYLTGAGQNWSVIYDTVRLP
jgi:16S rRNA (guanine1516-N2)-methyltransferase